MASKRVVVYFQHEREEALGRKVLPAAEFVQDSLAVGDADERQIAELVASGLTVSAVESSPTLTPGRAPGMHLITEALGDEDGDDSAVRDGGVALLAPDFPDRFKVRTLPGPFLPKWRTILEAKGARLEERLGPHAWLLRLTEAADLQRIRALDFVTQVRRYRDFDSGPVTPLTRRGIKSLPFGGPLEGVPASVYDVRLHRDEEVRAAARQLEAMGARVIGTGREKLRVEATTSLAASLAGLPAVAAVEAWQAPRLLCERARTLTHAQAPSQLAGGPLTGRGETIAIADTGIEETHDAFHGRMIHTIALARVGKADDPHGHGTHVAAIAAGGERRGSAFGGIAPEASLIVQALLDDEEKLGGLPVDLGDLLDQAYALGARIHNDSWGVHVSGAYVSSSREIDRFIWDHEDMLVIIAAGNEGTCLSAPPARRQSPIGFVDHWSVGAPATSKNALVVGASRSDRTVGGNAALTYGAHWPARFGEQPIADETNSGDPQSVAAFSSRGPTKDNRTKPDVVAPGTDILSAASATAPSWRFDGFAPGTNKTYGYLSGTSMAAPVVAGVAALLREWLRRVRGDSTPTAALMKSLIVGGARPLTGADATEGNTNGLPTWHQGYGRVDLAASVPLDGTFQLAYLDHRREGADAFLHGGATRRRYAIEVSAPCTLTVVMAYSDVAANSIQNDLNLVVETPTGKKYWGNEKLPSHLPRPDGTNNVELVRFDAQPGLHMVAVHASVLAHAPQGFALVVTGQLLTETLTPYR